ncbi:hypothetical protein e1012e08.tmp0321 [Eimeria tenella]|uniref:Uncharacterized protein n=1 Tax=Eimeria tenella TaxID=5802 RepID=C8TDM9_EIMTE|nr:hypothetical protein e1012e08.tmp0321 [Eimeria tenella]
MMPKLENAKRAQLFIKGANEGWCCSGNSMIGNKIVFCREYSRIFLLSCYGANVYYWMKLNYRVCIMPSTIALCQALEPQHNNSCFTFDRVKAPTKILYLGFTRCA